ncbi:hypothetical protein F0266_14900 [Vibrio coralliilyticus]|uniref:hypothetical protein n=1 Tax=Vibrio coralliilyticus TaxID=190893 RepID=UPI00148BAC25|nr:hypothetical protein [Vibrio coralliilyticus]NOH54226.1 hypothetical protein [Vibrio coralliilyticus]
MAWDFIENSVLLLEEFDEPPSFHDAINDYVDKHCSGSYRNLLLSVNTTTDSFKVKFGKNVLEHLK